MYLDVVNSLSPAVRVDFALHCMFVEYVIKSTEFVAGSSAVGVMYCHPSL